MPSLKDFRVRIASVKSTARITAAMKMVAAAKLRRAQEQAEAAEPYAERMNRMLSSVAASVAGSAGAPRLLSGTGSTDKQLLVVVSADRGLCGGFNTNIARYGRRFVQRVEGEGKRVQILCVGRKAANVLQRTHKSRIVDTFEGLSKPAPTYAAAVQVSTRLTQMYEAGEFDVCTIVFNKFVSALTQTVTPQQIIPFPVPEATAGNGVGGARASYEYEPDEQEILEKLLPQNLSVQIYRALLQSFASEQGARMTSMDSATRNAGDMINSLTLRYNRTRQAAITTELIEIISGAEALLS